ncbi:guanine nucleotide-binding protein subunit beta-like protein 1 [Dendroctonus ponderosae]
MTTGKAILPPDPLFIFNKNMGHVHSLCFPQRNPDYSDLLLAGTEQGNVYFLDLECNRVQHRQKMGESIQAIHSVEYDIITQEKSGLVKLWSIENSTSYTVQKTFESYGGFCKSVIFNQQLVLPQENGTLDTINLDTFETVNKFLPKEGEYVGSPMCLETFQIKGTKYLLVGYEDGHIILYDFITAKLCCQLKLKEFITSITFDPITCRGIASNSSNLLQLFRLDLQQFEIINQAELTLSSTGCQVVRFRPDHKLFMAGGWDGKLRVYSWRTLRALAILTQHKRQISDIQFSPNIVRYWDSKIFATGGADGTISLWNVYHSYTY